MSAFQAQPSSGRRSPIDEPSDEEKRTLWVGGISDQVDEEILYELFVNAGPLAGVYIPVDRETRRKKPFAFVKFCHPESVPYAVDVMRDVRLFGRPMRMQNKATGAGMNSSRSNYQRQSSYQNSSQQQQLSEQHRSHSLPSTPSQYQQQQMMLQQQQQQQMMMQQQMSNNPFFAQQMMMMQMQQQQQQQLNGFGHFDQQQQQHGPDRDRRDDDGGSNRRHSSGTLYDRHRREREDRRYDRDRDRNGGGGRRSRERSDYPSSDRRRHPYRR